MAEESARIAGTVTVDGVPAARDVIVISDNKGNRQVVGQGASGSDGSFDITYSGWLGPVIALALDSYGRSWASQVSLSAGTIVHPSAPNGYVYQVTVAGTTGASEPSWSTSGSVQDGSVTYQAKPYYRPVASGPLQGETFVELPTDEYFSDVVSLLHMDGVATPDTIEDVTGRPWAPFGNAALSEVGAVFGDGALELTGGGVETPATNDFDFGIGDFTIELFINTTSFPTSGPAILATGGASWADGQAVFRIDNGAYLSLYMYAIPGATLRDTAPLPTGQPVHVAITRKNGTFRLFRGGALVAENSARPTVPLNMNAGGLTVIGNSYFDGQGYDGYFDELRITKGVARYTAAFTPPAEPFADQGPA